MGHAPRPHNRENLLLVSCEVHGAEQTTHARVKNTYFHDVTPRTMNVPWHIQVVLSL